MPGFSFPRRPTGANLEVATARNNRQLEAYLSVRSHDPEFENSWANYGSGYADAFVWVDPAGFVHLQGRVDSGTNNTAIFTLPEEFHTWDGADHVFVVLTSAGADRLEVKANGVVRTVSAASHTWLSLDGVSFYRG